MCDFPFRQFVFISPDVLYNLNKQWLIKGKIIENLAVKEYRRVENRLKSFEQKISLHFVLRSHCGGCYCSMGVFEISV
jgi:hypothetical protein